MIPSLTIDEFKKIKRDATFPHYSAYVENDNSNHLIVYFGSYNGEFRGDQPIIQTNSNGLFIRSKPGTWYLEHHELGHSPKDVAKTLDKFILSKCHIKTVTLAGFSMGAFAALLYSTWMTTVNLVYANAPQTMVPINAKKVKVVPLAEMSSMFSIRELWERESSPKCKVLLSCCTTDDGSSDFKDRKDVEQLRHFPTVSIDIYDCVGHKQIGQHLLNDNYNDKFLIGAENVN